MLRILEKINDKLVERAKIREVKCHKCGCLDFYRISNLSQEGAVKDKEHRETYERKRWKCIDCGEYLTLAYSGWMGKGFNELEDK